MGQRQEKEIFPTEGRDDDFEYAVRANEVLEQIIYIANITNDPVAFAINVANILHENGLIAKAVYEVLGGAL